LTKFVYAAALDAKIAYKIGQCRLIQRCQIFLTYYNEKKYTKRTQNIPNDHEIYQMAVKQTEVPKTYQHFPFQDHPKNWDFGLKINHLATLD
jgi:hypothetical protein